MRLGRMYKDDLILDALNPAENELIVDLGGGTGHYAELIASYCREVVVVDESAAMLSHVPQVPNVKMLLHDIRNTSLSPEYCNAVLLTDVIHHIADQHEVIDEAYRILKSGGRLIILDFSASDVRIKVLGIFERLIFGSVYYRTPDQISKLLFNSKFTNITCNPCGWCYLITGWKT